MPASCIYEGLIRHRRTQPVHHEFDFRSFLLMIDLDEADTVFEKFWFWSTKRFSFARFKANDHLTKHLPSDNLTNSNSTNSDSANKSLRDRVSAVLKENNFDQPVGKVKLLTQLSYLGFSMNPISIFYCYEADGDQVIAIIAEVNNTPWGEQHIYFLPNENKTPIAADPDSRNSEKPKTIFGNHIDKTFHVSPFMSLDMHYRMAFSSPNDRLGVKIENHTDGDNGSERILDVSMTMKRKPLTSANLNWLLIKYPLVSFKIFAGIYWQALRLYLKKVPFVSHPRKAALANGQSVADAENHYDAQDTVGSQTTGQIHDAIDAQNSFVCDAADPTDVAQQTSPNANLPSDRSNTETALVAR